MTVDGSKEAVFQKVSSISGVTRVDTQPADNGSNTFLIETAQGQDLRRDLARAVVEGGFGLLELKHVGMSLEDIYLQLTTSEEPEGEEHNLSEPPTQMPTDAIEPQ
jgi:ABC-2 type transport system ATP-binding protein